MAKERKNLSLTELFGAFADHSHFFTGIIKRWTNSDNTSYVFSKIIIREGSYVCAQENDQKTLSANLNALCVLHVFYNLHEDSGVKAKISGEDFFLN